METNKIYNGDCYELIKQIPDKSIDLIYTDVPYLMEKHSYGKSDLGQRLKKVDLELNETYFKIAQDRLNGVNQKGEMDLFSTDFEEEQKRYEQGDLFNGS